MALLPLLVLGLSLKVETERSPDKESSMRTTNDQSEQLDREHFMAVLLSLPGSNSGPTGIPSEQRF